jgi:hypothetical protein
MDAHSVQVMEPKSYWVLLVFWWQFWWHFDWQFEANDGGLWRADFVTSG